MVLWSNREQTEIKLADGTEIKPTPGDVLLIANSVVEHRTPQVISKDRWFFRQYTNTPDWMEIANSA
jgi:hypothetical protein